MVMELNPTGVIIIWSFATVKFMQIIIIIIIIIINNFVEGT
jgi:hypothetical protein